MTAHDRYKQLKRARVVNALQGGGKFGSHASEAESNCHVDQKKNTKNTPPANTPKIAVLYRIGSSWSHYSILPHFGSLEQKVSGLATVPRLQSPNKPLEPVGLEKDSLGVSIPTYCPKEILRFANKEQKPAGEEEV